MATAIRWNASSGRVMTVHMRPKWREVSHGLKILTGAYLLLTLFAFPGLSLLWLARYGESCLHLRLNSTQVDAFEVLGLLLAAAASLFAYALILIGQWKCLTHAPQQHSGKEALFISLVSLLAGSALHGLALYFGGRHNFRVLGEGLSGLEAMEWLKPYTVLQLGGSLLIFVSFLALTQFVRVVATCLADARKMRRVEAYFLFVCLVVGGSIGVALCPNRLTYKTEVLWALAAGWLVCFLWHAALVLGARRGLNELLGQGSRTDLGTYRLDGESAPRPYSGLYRACVPPQR